jgi:hypothetical protein
LVVTRLEVNHNFNTSLIKHVYRGLELSQKRAEGLVPIRNKTLILTIAVIAAFVGPSIGTVGGTDAGASNTQENWQSLGWKSDTTAEATKLAIAHERIIEEIAADTIVRN